jgi:hypothetical protein
MTATRRTRGMAQALWLGWALAGMSLAAKPTPPLELQHGARIGLVSLLDAEITHYHAAVKLTGSSVKTQPVSWRVDLMFTEAVQTALSGLGLVAVALPPGDALRSAREACFLDANPNKPLTKECAAPYGELARSQHLDAIIVLGPGLNNPTHAEATRRKELPEYLRGFCVLTDGKPGAGAPTLLNFSELLLIANTPQGAVLAAREWGGAASSVWIGYTPAADPRQLSDAQVEQLQPQFAALLRGQEERLLTHLSVPH